jgi:hypothetical protein
VKPSPAPTVNHATGAPNKGGPSNRPRFTGTCTYCKRVGYRESQCFSKARDERDAANAAVPGGTTQSSQPSTGKTVNFGLTVLETCLEVASLSTTHGNSNLWIADTGASCHMTCSDEGMFNCKTIN